MGQTKSGVQTKLLHAFAVLCAAFLLFSVLLPVKGQARIYSSMLRFHVVAHSDSEQDQALKEALREAVLDWTAPGMSACGSVTEARAYLEENRAALEARIDAFLSERGAPYGAQMQLDDEYHPAKNYDGITLPQGVYLTLRITLGCGAGHNFFCVLFPPICQNSARTKPSGEVLLDYGFDQSDLRTLKTGNSVEYRFAILDFLRGLFG